MAFITLNKPPVNALSSNMISELLKAILEVSASPTARVLILASNAKHFCAGLDLKEQNGLEKKAAAQVVQDINRCFNALSDVPFPTICAMKGAALGGGAELSLAADFRIMTESGRIGFPETGLGIIPGAGGTQRLPRLIGLSKAKYWIFSAHQFSAEEALEDGVIDFICSDDELTETAIELAQEFLDNGPLGIRAAKRSIVEGSGLNLTDGLQIEQKAYESTLDTQDRQEALQAFAEKRPAQWKGC